ncbi:MAG TPA: biotin/lipoyl-binding protein, partial [Verrucomicrobiae bacterium]|nr:biotin/lipoyl-binding protein [Verrucomicrobiae bacterium]
MKVPEQPSYSEAAKPPGEQSTDRVSTAKPHRRRWTIVVLIVLLAGAGLLVFRGRSKVPPNAARAGGAPPPMRVSTATAKKGNIGVYVSALGVVTPVNTVAIKSRVDGQLIKVDYVEGQTVEKGEPLAEIDTAPFQAALTQAEGQLARDRALLENSRLDLERYKEAFAKNAIPKQQLDTQTSAVHQYEGAVKLDQGQIDNAKVQL